jgi:hypothetical protein
MEQEKRHNDSMALKAFLFIIVFGAVLIKMG